MAIVVLVLWLFTAGAGFYLLVTSNLGRARPAATTPAASQPQPASSRRGQQPTATASATPVAAPAAQPVPQRRLPRSARCGGRRGTGSTRPR